VDFCCFCLFSTVFLRIYEFSALTLVGAELRIDSVLRPKNAQNSTKNGKNLLLQKKFSNFSMDQFSSFYGENIFFPSKTSSDRFKLTYETKKKEEKNLMSRLEPLCRVTLGTARVMLKTARVTLGTARG
jgi:hypothetical protein